MTDPQATCACACHRMDVPYTGCGCSCHSKPEWAVHGYNISCPVCKQLDPTEKARELAKLLASLLNYGPGIADTNYSAFIEELSAALEAERKAGYDSGFCDRHKPGDPLCDKCDAEGYRRGREEAAKIAESYASNDELLHEAFKVVAEKIRAKAGELK